MNTDFPRHFGFFNSSWYAKLIFDSFWKISCLLQNIKIYYTYILPWKYVHRNHLVSFEKESQYFWNPNDRATYCGWFQSSNHSWQTKMVPFCIFKVKKSKKYSQMSGDNITRKLNHVFLEFLIRHSTVKVVYNRNYLINVNRSFFPSKWRLNADWRHKNLETKHSFFCLLSWQFRQSFAL